MPPLLPFCGFDRLRSAKQRHYAMTLRRIPKPRGPMKHVCTTRAMHAQLLCDLLEAEGIAATSGVSGGFLTGDTSDVWILEDSDFEKAVGFVEEFFRGESSAPSATWRCPTCGESVEDQFDMCWKCAAPVESADEATAPDKIGGPVSTSETIARTPMKPRCVQCDALDPGHTSWCANAESVQPSTPAFAVVQTAVGVILVLGGVLAFGLAALAAMFGTLFGNIVSLLMVSGAVLTIIGVGVALRAGGA